MSDSNQTDNGGKLVSIEVLRGLASILVCFFHFTHGDMKFVGTSKLFQSFFTNGWIGVEMFFVISGFVIPYSLVKSNYNFSSFRQFMSKRILRIEPPYVVSIILVIILGYLSSMAPGFKGQPFHCDSGQFLAHFVYLTEHVNYQWIQPVYWTLEIEFHYYLFIGLILPFLWKNKTSFFLGISFFLLSGHLIDFTIFKYADFFSLGMIAAAYQLGKIKIHYFWTFFLLIMISMVFESQGVLMISAGVITTFCILFLKFSNRVFLFLGQISYSLYLIHVPIGGRVINLGSRFADKDWEIWCVLFVAILVSLISAWLFNKLIEKPSQKLSYYLSSK
jgi:peptidoglycan/LPS O-acetylase OafA/YrhL